MYYHDLNPNIVLAYHGCDASVADEVLNGARLQASDNEYDWLGPGIYFWESNPERALAFAELKKRRGDIKNPFVVGAALQLGNCIDMLNQGSIVGVQQAYNYVKALSEKIGAPLPKNGRFHKRLDNLVFVTLHELIKQAKLPEADSVRGMYHEGGRIYHRGSFFDKSHTQICIRENSYKKCIKGVFRVEF